MQELLAVVQESGAGFVSGKGVGPAYHSTNRPLFHSRIAPFALHHGAGIDDVIPVLCHPLCAATLHVPIWILLQKENDAGRGGRLARQGGKHNNRNVTSYTSTCRIQR